MGAPPTMTPHPFEDDGDGDCRVCNLRANARFHTTPEPDRRSFNLRTREEGMADAATSATSEDVRLTLFLAMAEVATRKPYLSMNDAWDLLEERGYKRTGHAQSAGTIGPSGASIGLWVRTDRTDENTSGNLHSTDNRVRVYRSLIVGRDLADVEPAVREKAAALDKRAAERARAAAEAAPDVVIREEWSVLTARGARVRAATEGEARLILHPGAGGRVQRRTVIEYPWENP